MAQWRENATACSVCAIGTVGKRWLKLQKFLYGFIIAYR
jgi:hypothetical protein